jgi:hypothetical protein
MYIVMCSMVCVTKWRVLVWIIGFINTLVTHTCTHAHARAHTHTHTHTLKYMQYSAIADLHTFQFTIAHALGFSVSASRFLAVDLSTETSTQITTSITPKIFQLHFQYHCTVAYIKSWSHTSLHCWLLRYHYHILHVKSSNHTLDPHRPTSCILL